MELAALHQRLDALVPELAQCNGYRTVWLDPSGRLMHAEPDDELEAHGFSYVATLMRPSREDLVTAVLRSCPVEAETPVHAYVATGLDAALAPAG